MAFEVNGMTFDINELFQEDTIIQPHFKITFAKLILTDKEKNFAWYIIILRRDGIRRYLIIFTVILCIWRTHGPLQ